MLFGGPWKLAVDKYLTTTPELFHDIHSSVPEEYALTIVPDPKGRLDKSL